MKLLKSHEFSLVSLTALWAVLKSVRSFSLSQKLSLCLSLKALLGSLSEFSEFSQPNGIAKDESTRRFIISLTSFVRVFKPLEKRVVQVVSVENKKTVLVPFIFFSARFT